VQESSSKSRDHRLRVLEHQARIAGERPAAPPRTAEAQGTIPLLVEVKAIAKPARGGRARAKARAKQPRFEGL
jgi:hypothetical protein